MPGGVGAWGAGPAAAHRPQHTRRPAAAACAGAPRASQPAPGPLTPAACEVRVPKHRQLGDQLDHKDDLRWAQPLGATLANPPCSAPAPCLVADSAHDGFSMSRQIVARQLRQRATGWGASRRPTRMLMDTQDSASSATCTAGGQACARRAAGASADRTLRKGKHPAAGSMGRHPPGARGDRCSASLQPGAGRNPCLVRGCSTRPPSPDAPDPAASAHLGPAPASPPPASGAHLRAAPPPSRGRCSKG